MLEAWELTQCGIELIIHGRNVNKEDQMSISAISFISNGLFSSACGLAAPSYAFYCLLERLDFSEIATITEISECFQAHLNADNANYP